MHLQNSKTAEKGDQEMDQICLKFAEYCIIAKKQRPTEQQLNNPNENDQQLEKQI